MPCNIKKVLDNLSHIIRLQMVAWMTSLKEGKRHLLARCSGSPQTFLFLIPLRCVLINCFPIMHQKCCINSSSFCYLSPISLVFQFSSIIYIISCHQIHSALIIYKRTSPHKNNNNNIQHTVARHCKNKMLIMIWL